MVDYEKINNLRRQKQYLKVARSALNRYLREQTYLSYLNPQNKPFYYLIGEEKKVLLANGLSIYILEYEELLSKNQIKKLNNIYKDKSLRALKEFEKYEQKLQYPVLDISSNLEGNIVLGSNNEDQFFDSKNFNYSKKLLGEDTKYYLCRKQNACIARSENGKGLILGLYK